MSTNIFTQEYIKSLFQANSFPHDFSKRPVVVVYRNTDAAGNQLADTGMNNCDRVLLVDATTVHHLEGRTYVNDQYLSEQLKGLRQTNYIASGYYGNAWGKGKHFGYRALVQISPFLMWRSKDMELMNQDDWNMFAIVADNFHGWAPASAGCVTVKGDMKNPAHDWKIADNWVYNTHAGDAVFSAAIFHHWDLDGAERLRIGSTGTLVRECQTFLNKNGATLKVDGDFGPATHYAVRAFQTRQGRADSGMIKVSEFRSAPATNPPATPPAPAPSAAASLLARIKNKSKTELLRLALEAGITVNPDDEAANIAAAIVAENTRARSMLAADFREKSLAELLLANPSVFPGLSTTRDGSLQGMGVGNVRDLGANRFSRAARVLEVLAKV